MTPEPRKLGVNSEQQLREAVDAQPFVSLPNQKAVLAAVGRLLDPIPDELIDYAAKAIYRASFPEPAKDDGPWTLAPDVVRARYRQMALWAIEEDRGWLIGGKQ